MVCVEDEEGFRHKVVRQARTKRKRQNCGREHNRREKRERESGENEEGAAFQWEKERVSLLLYHFYLLWMLLLFNTVVKVQ